MGDAKIDASADKSVVALVPEWIRQLVRFRYGYLFLFSIALWVLLAMLFAPQAIVDKALKLDTYLQLTFLSAVNLVASVFAVAVLRILFHRHPPVQQPSKLRRVIGGRDAPWGWTQYVFSTCVASLSPIVLAWQYGSEFGGWWYTSQDEYHGASHLLPTCLSIAGGFAVGWGFLVLVAYVKSILFGSEKETRNFFPFEDVDRRGLLRLRGAAANKKSDNASPPDTIDVQLGAYLFLLVGAHYIASRTFPAYLPVLVFVLMVAVLIQWIAFLFLAGLAYWLDKIHVPVVLVLLVGMIVSNMALQRQHTLKTRPDVSKARLNQIHAGVGIAYRNALESGDDLALAVKTSASPLEEIAWGAIQQRMVRIFAVSLGQQPVCEGLHGLSR